MFIVCDSTNSIFESNKEVCIQNRKYYFELQEKLWDLGYRSRWQKSEKECNEIDLENLFNYSSMLDIDERKKNFNFVSLSGCLALRMDLYYNYTKNKKYPIDIKEALDNFDEIFINKNEEIIEELEKESYIRYRMEIIEREKER